MKRRIKTLFKSYIDSENDYGEISQTTSNKLEIGAEVYTQTQAQVSRLGLEVGNDMVKCFVRHTRKSSTIDNNDILEIDGNDFQILSVNNIDNKDKRIEILAKRIQ